MAGQSSTTLTMYILLMLLFSTLSSSQEDVIFCGGTSSWCHVGSTCCCSEVAADNSCSVWACCPFENAICCDDHKHCCRPEFPVCDNDTDKCKLRMGNPLGVKATNLIPAGQIGKSSS